MYNELILLLVPKSFENKLLQTIYGAVTTVYRGPILIIRNTKEEWDLKKPRRLGRKRLLKLLRKQYLDDILEEFDAEKQESDVQTEREET